MSALDGERGTAALIEAERMRQMLEEGYTSEQDDKYTDGQLLSAARCYVMAATVVADQPEACAASQSVRQHGIASVLGVNVPAWHSQAWTYYGQPCPPGWPWPAPAWKPSLDPHENLVKAGALIAAEGDRILRSLKPPARRSGSAGRPVSVHEDAPTAHERWLEHGPDEHAELRAAALEERAAEPARVRAAWMDALDRFRSEDVNENERDQR